MRIRRFVVLAIGALLAAAAPGAHAALGDRLALVSPSPGGDGRGIAVRPGTSIGFTSTQGSEASIYRVGLPTGASAGTLTTTLDATASYGFGALSWQPAGDALWGSEYSGAHGWVDRVDGATGAVTRAFDASAADPRDTGVDGLAYDPDGTLWVSGDGVDDAGGTTIDHFTADGTLLGSFTVPFGNSGIEVDGDDLWLSDYTKAQLREYTKAGTAVAAMSFPTTGLGEPEDLSIDTCTFAGRKAIWAYGAGVGGRLAAYEIGSSDNAGCGGVTVGAGGAVAGRPVALDATSPGDPSGTLLAYRWTFGDRGAHQVRAPGRVRHTYACPGFYPLRVAVRSASGALVARLRALVVVQFTPGATRVRAGREMRPVALIAGRRLTFYLSTQPLRRGAPAVTSVDYRLGERRVARRDAAARVRFHLARTPRPHRLTVTVHVGDAPPVRIASCFFA